MAFEHEGQFQQLIHENPSIILDGIPEINPELCDNTPQMLSLGTEINIQGKRVDNLFIDTNGILTIVECKLYEDSRLDREVYPQIINYASGLKDLLVSILDKNKFFEKFFNIVKDTNKSENLQFNEGPEELIDILAKKEIMLANKDIEEWKSEFKKHFKKNIEEEIFRLIIISAPRIGKKNNINKKTVNNFDQKKIKNLIQIVNFSESKSNKYELIIMDSRLNNKSKYIEPKSITKNDMVSRIIWRNYDSLREVPLISKYKRSKLNEDSLKEALLENTKSEKVFDFVKEIINDDWIKSNLSIDWQGSGVALKYPKKINGIKYDFNFGQFNQSGCFANTSWIRGDFIHLIRSEYGKKNKIKDPHSYKITKPALDMLEKNKSEFIWNLDICEKYFNTLTKIIKNSSYKYNEDKYSNKELFSNKQDSKYPKIELLIGKKNEFINAIKEFILELNQVKYN